MLFDSTVPERVRTFSQPALVKRLIDMFTDRVEVRLGDIHNALGAGDLDAARKAAHSLKNSAANLGLGDLETALREIELAAAEGDGIASAQFLAEARVAATASLPHLLAYRETLPISA